MTSSTATNTMTVSIQPSTLARDARPAEPAMRVRAAAYVLVVGGAAAASWLLVGPGPGRAAGVLVALGLTASAVGDVT